jgi:hypothetical protein
MLFAFLMPRMCRPKQPEKMVARDMSDGATNRGRVDRRQTAVLAAVAMPAYIALGVLSTAQTVVSVAIVVGVAFLIAVWRRPTCSIAALAIFPLLLGSDLGGGLVIRVAAAIAVSLALLRLWQRRRRSKGLSWLTLFAGAALAVQALGALRQTSAGYTQAVLAGVGLSLLGLALGIEIGKIASRGDKAHFRVLGWAILTCLAVTSITAIPSQLTALEAVKRSSTYIPRGSGLLDTPGGPNILGVLLMALLLLSLGMVQRVGRNSGLRHTLIRLLGTGALFFTYSRRAWSGFLVGGMFFLTQSRSMRARQVIILALATLGLVATLMTSAVVSADLEERFETIDYGVTARATEYDRLSDLSALEWVVGKGPGSNLTYDAGAGADAALHSSYLVLIVDFGLLGLLPVICATLLAGIKAGRSRYQTPLLSAGACVLAIAIASLFGEMIVYGVVGPLFWFAIGVLAPKAVKESPRLAISPEGWAHVAPSARVTIAQRNA